MTKYADYDCQILVLCETDEQLKCVDQSISLIWQNHQIHHTFNALKAFGNLKNQEIEHHIPRYDLFFVFCNQNEVLQVELLVNACRKFRLLRAPIIVVLTDNLGDGKASATLEAPNSDMIVPIDCLSGHIFDIRTLVVDYWFHG